MTGIESVIIGCWLIWSVFWTISAVLAKKAQQRQPIGKRLWYTACLVLSFWLLLVSAQFRVSGRDLTTSIYPLYVSVLPKSAIVDVITVALTISGLLLALWSRTVLGRNWSSNVDFKIDHALVTKGPYAVVRHPIYTAMLSMFLGTAAAIGALGGFLGFIILAISLWIKLQQEEALMTNHFPDIYPEYTKRTKALIPFLF